MNTNATTSFARKIGNTTYAKGSRDALSASFFREALAKDGANAGIISGFCTLR